MTPETLDALPMYSVIEVTLAGEDYVLVKEPSPKGALWCPTGIETFDFDDGAAIAKHCDLGTVRLRNVASFSV